MIYGPYKAQVDKIHDGDTIYMYLDVGFDVVIYGRCRVYGINAPELSTQEGKDAKAYAESICPAKSFVTVLSHGWDKYGGRFDGEITLPNRDNFGMAMVATGHAKVYLP